MKIGIFYGSISLNRCFIAPEKFLYEVMTVEDDRTAYLVAGWDWGSEVINRPLPHPHGERELGSNLFRTPEEALEAEGFTRPSAPAGKVEKLGPFPKWILVDGEGAVICTSFLPDVDMEWRAKCFLHGVDWQ